MEQNVEEMMQLFLECKSHFNDIVKQAKLINVNNWVLFKQIKVKFEESNNILKYKLAALVYFYAEMQLLDAFIVLCLPCQIQHFLTLTHCLLR